VLGDDALTFIQNCLNDEERYFVRDHFEMRMSMRGMFWPDILQIVEEPKGVRMDGIDKYGREHCSLNGLTTANAEIEILCVLERDPNDNTIFWMIYWE
jgi:hypothetical protein